MDALIEILRSFIVEIILAALSPLLYTQRKQVKIWFEQQRDKFIRSIAQMNRFHELFRIAVVVVIGLALMLVSTFQQFHYNFDENVSKNFEKFSVVYDSMASRVYRQKIR